LNDVTRLAECTGFDRLDVPNFYAIRPSALHPCAVVSSGKGLTKNIAILSALFECYERWAAEQPFGRVFTLSEGQLRSQFPGLAVAIPAHPEIVQPIPWVVGFDLISQRPCFLPLKKVVFPYGARHPAIPALSSNTNGLAAGEDPFETICAALLETIERDAVSRLNQSPLNLIDVSGATGTVAALIDRFNDNGITLSVTRCPSPLDVPTFYCLTKDDRFSMSSLFCSGSAAHPDETEALTRALLEVTQSRIAFISTLRDDVGPQVLRQLTADYETRAATFSTWFSTIPRQPLGRPPTRSSPSPRFTLKALLSQIRTVRPDTALACARLREAPGLVAFRVYSADLHELTKS
jgi:YcaO-like protein with predicted kinase domain